MSTTSRTQREASWDEADRLIGILQCWGIGYLVGENYPISSSDARRDQQSAIKLIQSLAQCEYPRVRDASISLFLLHPELAAVVIEAIRTSEPAVSEQIITLTLATLYLQRLWSIRLTLALGRVPNFPEQTFAQLWQRRRLPPPAYHYGRWGLLALQDFEQRRTGLPLNFLHDWQNQVDHLLFQEETQKHHLTIPVKQLLEEDEKHNVGEDSEMSMRPNVDKTAGDKHVAGIGYRI